MTRWRILVVGLVGGGATVHDGRYLSVYDPDAPTMDTTTDPAESMVFESLEAASSAWAQTSLTVPLRPDGLPNRPLTAFTIAVETVEEDQ